MKHNTQTTLREASRQLAVAGVKHVIVEAMAIRSHKYESEILKDVHAIAQVIRKSLRNVPQNYQRISTLRGKPVYQMLLSLLDVPQYITDKYPDLKIEIAPGVDRSQGCFRQGYNMIQLTYVPAMVDVSVIDFRPVFRGLDVVIEHEVRHFIDYSTGLHKNAMDNLRDGNRDGSFKGYYSTEHEIDARLTSLFLKANTLIKGSALLALEGKVDAMTKEHRSALADPTSFWLWLFTVDKKFSIRSISLKDLTEEALTESEGKAKEIWKFFHESYAMAFRLVKSEAVTPAQKKAWIALHNELKDRKPSKSDVEKIRKIATK